MKSKFNYVLFIFISLFLSISLFNKDMRSMATVSNQSTNKQDTDSESINMNEKKIIYLTFDDGPSCEVTDKVLDILKENKVQATFFLIGSQIQDKEDVLKRIYEEGHSIGLHTYTHNFRKIYCNEDKFIQEMIICRSKINETVGVSPNIIRFPGGSYKHLSKNYLEKLHNNKFKVYDWNLDNCDGLNPKIQPYNLYTKAIQGSNNMDKIILLMHCTDLNKNTCVALPEIINYYKSHGYEFKLITEETAELYFSIKK